MMFEAPMKVPQKLEGYDVAQICRNGHIINGRSLDYPESNAAFCDKCGSGTISKCEKCSQDIRGKNRGWMTVHEMPLPGFCRSCGGPYPWTAAALEAARQYTDELDQLSTDEREQLKGTLTDLTVDSPRTALAATRYQNLISKAGPVATAAMKQIMVPAAVEAAKVLIDGWLK
jgi:hypothetical protein